MHWLREGIASVGGVSYLPGFSGQNTANADITAAETNMADEGWLHLQQLATHIRHFGGASLKPKCCS